MKKVLFLSFFFAFCSLAKATTYYFSSISGNDANDGLTASTPLASLSKMSTVSGYASTDVISLEKGSLWIGVLTVNKSNITINSYAGSSNKTEKPIITTLQPVTNFTSVPGKPNIWRVYLNASSL